MLRTARAKGDSGICHVMLRGSPTKDIRRRRVMLTENRPLFTQTDGSASFAICSHAMENGLVWYSLTKVSNNGERASAYGLLRLSKDGCEYLTEPMFEEISVPDSGFGNFSEGLSPVKLNGSWGYIDETAQWVIPPQYDDASSFRDGLALVEKDGKLMYIDHSGAVVWKER